MFDLSNLNPFGADAETKHKKQATGSVIRASGGHAVKI